MITIVHVNILVCKSLITLYENREEPGLLKNVTKALQVLACDIPVHKEMLRRQQQVHTNTTSAHVPRLALEAIVQKLLPLLTTDELITSSTAEKELKTRQFHLILLQQFASAYRK
jgi:hypothetical protein